MLHSRTDGWTWWWCQPRRAGGSGRVEFCLRGPSTAGRRSARRRWCLCWLELRDVHKGRLPWEPAPRSDLACSRVLEEPASRMSAPTTTADIHLQPAAATSAILHNNGRYTPTTGGHVGYTPQQRQIHTCNRRPRRLYSTTTTDTHLQPAAATSAILHNNGRYSNIEDRTIHDFQTISRKQ